MKNKKAYFFSLDAFLALLIILGVILFIKPSSIQVSEEIHLQEDLLMVLSSLKIGEIDNVYAKQLISSGNITNLNQSVLEQIGEFYANSLPEANLLAESVLSELNLDENIGLYFNGAPITTSEDISFDSSDRAWVSRQIISGIQQGDSVRGYSSRAFLSSENTIDYFYFGGYVGDGNITVKLEGDVIGANIEAAFSGDFDLYINNQSAGSYTPPKNIPYKINLISYLNLFTSEDNYIDFKSDNNLYIAGGFIKVVYNESTALPVRDSVHNLPGIDGLINFYDSFYVPENLNSMEIFLHYDSLYDIFLRIGDEKVYSENSGGSETSIIINNSYLSSVLNYSSMSKKTIPLRLGIENVSHVFNFSLNADVFSVTDLSGSMQSGCSGASWWCCLFSGDWCGSKNTCNNCGGILEDKIGLAKLANKAFIDSVLNHSDNRIGLVGYNSMAPDSEYHQLSNDSVSLKSKVDDWTATGTTCICCGINKAVDKMLLESSPGRFRSIVIMSDGEANVRCAQQGTGNAKQDAIQAACDAYNNYNLTVYSIGFGSDADETTLQSISSCGNGNYYYSDVDELIVVYQQIADDIIKAAYSEQTVIGEGIFTKLYPDSYISLDYSSTIPYGLIITTETPEFGNLISEGSFIIPDDTSPYKIKVISYSGSKWTDKVEVYNNGTGIWESVFDLGIYNQNYVDLGDPYVVNIPLDKIKVGNNSIRVSTGLNSFNSSGGSIYDKVIYSLVKNISSYSSIVSSAEGCIWNITFEDDSNSLMVFPDDYSGTQNCFYTPEDISYNNNDALNVAIYNLLTSLDLNSNRKIETKFSENDLTINSIEVTGIPFTWETEVQARVWR